MNGSFSGALMLVVMGLILASSILADALAKRLRLPRISVLVLFGIVFSAFGEDLFGARPAAVLGPVSDWLISIALVMVAFLLGGDLSLARLRELGRPLVQISLAVALLSFIVTGLGLTLAGYGLMLAIPLAALSVATDPAAVHDVVTKGGQRKPSRVGNLLLGIVAIDDVWGILVFGFAMASLVFFETGNGAGPLMHAMRDLGGALALGAVIGAPAAWMSGRLKPGEPILVEAVAIVLLIAGLSDLLEVSPLLSAMTAGFLVANLPGHHTRPFREIEHIEWPFLVFFFVLAGARFDPVSAGEYWLLILTFVVLRLAGRYLGGLAAVKAFGIARETAPSWIGLGLAPQAGIAIGMALLAGQQVPQYEDALIAIAVTSTVIFEIAGPILTARLLKKARAGA